MKPNFAIITEIEKEDKVFIAIDTSKASYQGLKWRTLGDFGKRKFENLLFLTRSKEQLEIRYV